SAQIREILISESAWEEMTCLFAPSLTNSNTILKGAEDNGVGFILESNGSPVTLLNITNSSKGYTNLKEIAAKSKLTDTTVSIPITASYYVYDTNKVKSGALEATALINVKYD
ncbi:fimbrial protein, partial [Escherichia coli]